MIFVRDGEKKGVNPFRAAKIYPTLIINSLSPNTWDHCLKVVKEPRKSETFFPSQISFLLTSSISSSRKDPEKKYVNVVHLYCRTSKRLSGKKNSQGGRGFPLIARPSGQCNSAGMRQIVPVSYTPANNTGII